MYDLAILDGTLIFPETSEEMHGNLYLKNGRIEKISSNFLDAQKTITAKGQIVSPGFIDIHMHREGEFTPDLPFSRTNEMAWLMARQGVTTAVGGNCGVGYADFQDHIGKVQALGTPINYMAYVGYSRLRESINLKDRHTPAEKKEIGQMRRKIREAMDAGCVGLSVGLEYTPGICFDEMLKIVEPLKDYPGALTSIHFRSDADKSIESIDEMISLSRISGIPVNIGHLNSCAAFGYMEKALDKLKQAVNSNVDISIDTYPYSAFCTILGSSIFDAGCLERWNTDYQSLLVADGKYAGVRFDKALFKRLRKEAPQTLVVAFVMREKEVIMAMADPLTMIASDGTILNGKGHPRSAGTFPKVLGHYCRKKDVLSFMDALKKITTLPAKRLGLRQKGILEEGADADIVIFDKEKIIDRASYEQPNLPPDGIAYVIVNGNVVLEKNKVIMPSAGKIIRKNYH